MVLDHVSIVSVLFEMAKFFSFYSRTATCGQLKCTRVYDKYIDIEYCKCVAIFAIFDEKWPNSGKKTIRW